MAVVVVVVLAIAALFIFKSSSGSAPLGQPPLVRLVDVSQFDAEFSAACDQVRVLVLLSPT
jgi:hypothetical protein